MPLFSMSNHLYSELSMVKSFKSRANTCKFTNDVYFSVHPTFVTTIIIPIIDEWIYEESLCLKKLLWL